MNYDANNNNVKKKNYVDANNDNNSGKCVGAKTEKNNNETENKSKYQLEAYIEKITKQSFSNLLMLMTRI